MKNLIKQIIGQRLTRILNNEHKGNPAYKNKLIDSQWLVNKWCNFYLHREIR